MPRDQVRRLGFAWLILAPAVLLQPQAEYDTLVGIHEELSHLSAPPTAAAPPDFSSRRLEQRRSRLDTLKTRLQTIETEGWPRERRVDFALVAARWNELDFEMRVTKPWQRDPGFYLDLVRRPAFTDLPVSVSDRQDLERRLRAIPEILAEARTNLIEPARELVELALFHLDNYDGVGQAEPLRSSPPPGVIGWYEDLLVRANGAQPELRAAAGRALEALKEFREWLVQRAETTGGRAAVGLDEYGWYVRHVRLMPYSVEEIRALGNRELERSAAFLQIEKNRNRSLPPLRLAGNKEEYQRRVEEAEKRIRTFLTEQRLLQIPEGLGPFETDAFWRAGMKRHFWEEIQYRDALNNHIHASIPGHRFDRIVAAGIENPIRAAHRDGGRIEGWAFYIEEMLLQAGLLEHRPRARELFYIAQLARALRIPTELKMQSGELNLEEAIGYMVERVPLMEKNLARYDLEIYLRRPTYGMNYVMGRIQLERLLSDRARQLGEDFQLGAFHDRFLSYGWIPISLIRWEMTGLDDEVKELLEGLL